VFWRNRGDRDQTVDEPNARGRMNNAPSQTSSDKPIRIVFFGTAELARPVLVALAERRDLFDVNAVVTQPDRPKGRDLKLQASPVKLEAVRRGLPVLQPERARDTVFIQKLDEFRPDLIVVTAYGQILPATLLNVPARGCLNVHTSLLPAYRGAAPIQWAILNDERETGVTIMKMDVGLDTGDILASESTPISRDDNAQALHDRLATMGAALLVRTIPLFLCGQIVPRPQPAEGASYARKISKEDGRLDWTAPARALWNRIRAFTPWPGAYTFLSGDGTSRLLKIWQAEVTETTTGTPGDVIQADRNGLAVACGRHALRILSLQLEGGRRLPARDFLAGHHLAVGTKLG